MYMYVDKSHKYAASSPFSLFLNNVRASGIYRLQWNTSPKMQTMHTFLHIHVFKCILCKFKSKNCNPALSTERVQSSAFYHVAFNELRLRNNTAKVSFHMKTRLSKKEIHYAILYRTQINRTPSVIRIFR